MGNSNEQKVILVTGGAGYIGSKLIRDLVVDPRSSGSVIRIYDNLHRQHFCGMMDLPSQARFEFIEGDVLDRMNLGRAMRDVDLVIHLAAIVKTPLSFDHPEWTQQVNHWGTANVVECAIEAEVRRLLYVSSASVYGPGGPFAEDDACRPVGPYATSKRQGEVEVQQGVERGLSAGIVRLGTVFGSAPAMRFDAVAGRLAYLVGVGRPMTIYGSGGQRRPLIHIHDASKALLLCAERLEGIVNAATLTPTVSEIATGIQQLVPAAEIQYTDQDVLTEVSFEVNSGKLTGMGFRAEYDLEKGLRDMLGRWRGFHKAAGMVD